MLGCARWPFTPEDAAAIRTLVSPAVDWTRFLALCRHHRLTPLVYRALVSSGADVPAETLATLKSAATGNTMNTLAYLAETARLRDLLRQAGIAVRVLKGVPLSQQAFADPCLRDVGDIDLLIETGTDLSIGAGTEETADRVLMADGFRRSDPTAPLTPRRRRSWRKHGKDYTYLNDRNGFEIDLHWRLFRNPHMPGNALAAADGAASEAIRLGDTEIAVLPVERGFLYLCVHGALDGWFRFKSLVDLAALWRSFDEERRAAIAALAQEHAVLPEMAAALRLAQQLALLRADEVAVSMQLQANSREVRWILDYAQRQHVAQAFQPTPDGAGSWAPKRYELGLRRGFAYRFEILRRVLLRPRVWARFNLPDALFPLYGLLSPLEWVLFHQGAAATDGKGRMRANRWRRWRALSGDERRLLAEAGLAMLLARGALSLLPMRRVFRWMEQAVPPAGTSGMPRAGMPPSGMPPSGSTEADATEIAESIRWAVLTVARYGPLSFVCFPQALAGHAMLRRRGIRSIVHYGVRRAADRTMRAHTWLEVNHHMLLGGESALLFAPIHSTGARSEPS